MTRSLTPQQRYERLTRALHHLMYGRDRLYEAGELEDSQLVADVVKRLSRKLEGTVQER